MKKGVNVACYHPINAYRKRGAYNQLTKKWPITFNVMEAHPGTDLIIPCGQCIGCRLERSRQWAIRCMYEAKEYGDNNMFLTLTYDEDHLPEGRSLELRHFQLFMKKLRKRTGSGVRFFHCGEYGAMTQRPHYHACIFGFRFDDMYVYRDLGKYKMYRSPTLELLWKHGNSMIGDVTFESAQYVARYIVKKHLGKGQEEHYEYVDEETGEVHYRKPEYTTMSRRPGIGSAHYDKYKGDIYPLDKVVVREGKTIRPPRFYDSKYEMEYPEDFKKVKNKRRLNFLKKENNSLDFRRLETLEKIQESKFKRFEREPERVHT